MVAVEGGIEREGEELTERGLPGAGADRLGRKPAALAESPAAPTRAGRIAAGFAHRASSYTASGASPAAARGHSIGNPDDLRHLPDRVHADDVRAGQDARGDRRGGSPVALRGRNVAERGLQERLSGRPAEQGTSERGQAPEERQRLIGMPRLLRESQARVQDDRVPADPRPPRRASIAARQLRGDRRHQIAVTRLLVHVPRAPAIVHQHDRRTRLGDDGGRAAGRTGAR